MENASKALIMAGEVLIAIIILSILVAVIMAFGSYSSNVHKDIEKREIDQFNTNFQTYEGRVNITAQEIASIINFAKKENDKNEFKLSDANSNKYGFINVFIDMNGNFIGSSFFTGSNNKYVNNKEQNYNNSTNFNNILNNFIKANNNYYFRCCASVKDIDSTTYSGVKYITTETKLGDSEDIKYNSEGKAYQITFHKIKESDFKVSDSIEVETLKTE